MKPAIPHTEQEAQRGRRVAGVRAGCCVLLALPGAVVVVVVFARRAGAGGFGAVAFAGGFFEAAAFLVAVVLPAGGVASGPLSEGGRDDGEADTPTTRSSPTFPLGYVRTSSSSVGSWRSRASAGSWAAMAAMIFSVSATASAGPRPRPSTGGPTRRRTAGGESTFVRRRLRCSRGRQGRPAHRCSPPGGPLRSCPSTPDRRRHCPVGWSPAEARRCPRPLREPARPVRATRGHCPLAPRGCLRAPGRSGRRRERRRAPSCRGTASAGLSSARRVPGRRRRSSCGGWRRG